MANTPVIIFSNLSDDKDMTKAQELGATDYMICLLYTSDAADERSSVDLGGRRIIKKKKNEEHDEDRITKI